MYIEGIKSVSGSIHRCIDCHSHLCPIYSPPVWLGTGKELIAQSIYRYVHVYRSIYRHTEVHVILSVVYQTPIDRSTFGILGRVESRRGSSLL